MEIEYYQKTRGNYPALEFIKEQPIKVQNKILRAKDFLRDNDLYHSMKKRESEKIQPYKNLYSLRVSYGGMWYRIFFCVKNNTACFLFGIKKYGDKLIKSDTDKADQIVKNEIGWAK